MSSTIALFIFIVGILGLFFLDRDKSVRTSKALWLPVIWMWIEGSRPVSSWLQGGTLINAGPNASSGNFLDQLVAGILLVLGIIVVISRGRHVIFLLRRNWPIALYFFFCFASALWSDFPGQTLQRWIKALGELVMVMIIATEAEPIAALARFFSRVGFVLLPASVLLLKYYPNLAVAYDEYGFQMNTGVSTNKNMLGVLVFVLGLGTLWQVLGLLRDRKRPNRTRHLLAQCGLLYFAIALLFSAHSATSGACFTLGAVIMLATAQPLFGRRPAAVHLLILAILLSGGLTMVLGGEAAVTKAMGRSADLTGRMDVWKLVIPMAPNPILGAGFETFWFGPRLQNLQRIYPGVNEAHDGYLEIYLNLGLFGVGLIALIFIQGYRGAIVAFRRDPALGSLLVAYIVTAAIYSISEAGFRMLHPIWFALLLSIVVASVVTEVGERLSQARQELTYPAFGKSGRDPLDPNPAGYIHSGKRRAPKWAADQSTSAD